MLKNYYLIKMKYSDIKMFIHCNNCNSGVLEVGQTHAGILFGVMNVIGKYVI